MANATRSQDRIDQFFSGPGARADRAGEISWTLLEAWRAGSQSDKL
jgi:hypothetical protein